MTDREKFQKTFDKLHASPDVLTEVLDMIDERNKALDQGYNDIFAKTDVGSRNDVHKTKRKMHYTTKVAVAAVVVALIGATSAYAYYEMKQTVVNGQELPDIGEMSCIDGWDFQNIDESEVYSDYREIMDITGLDLLDSTLSESNPYMQVRIDTDKENYAIISVENYILGDTRNYQLVEDVNLYNCDPGEVYYSDISLEVDLILGPDQKQSGLMMDYLGAYDYVETYTTEDGTSVNLLQDTTGGEVSEKIAIFIKDGVQYTLSGRVPVDEMKRVVESMQ